jgi:formamidopyrimidine-DNA glycosylase
VTIDFTDNSQLFFNDQRKFGWMKLYPTIEVPNIVFMQKLGPEPLEDNFTADIFYERLQRRRNTTIKAAILDQTVLAGVGNIYADEGLWGAKIHPATRVKDVSPGSVIDLWREIRDVMTLAIEKGGSSNHTYINAEGKKGSYMDFARVFRREGLACPRHPDVLIEKIRVAGRGTHICPVCQSFIN